MRRIDISRHRRRAGVSQVWLARRLGVAQNTVSNWESGRCQPMAGYLPDLAEIFQCCIEDLYEPADSTRGTNLVLVEGQTEVPW